jgi:hypothetical protein
MWERRINESKFKGRTYFLFGKKRIQASFFCFIGCCLFNCFGWRPLAQHNENSKQTQTSFNNASGGFDAVLGARGSKLQLILNALFHLDASPEIFRGNNMN